MIRRQFLKALAGLPALLAGLWGARPPVVAEGTVVEWTEKLAADIGLHPNFTFYGCNVIISSHCPPDTIYMMSGNLIAQRQKTIEEWMRRIACDAGLS